MRSGGLALLGTAALLLPAAAGASEVDDAGVVFRVGGDGARHFHPLASFGSLNSEVTAGRPKRVERLADSLLERAEPQGHALVWRYRLPSYERPPWTSGLAQAVAAQALARAGRKAEARQAFRAIPGELLIPLPQGPWIRLYEYDDLVVLNAQLQAALSIGEYGRLVDDPRARRLAASMRRAAAALLPRFDSGAWSRYSLDGREANLEYHEFVTSLLWKVADRDPKRIWRTYAARFRDYRHRPPEVQPGGPPKVVYPTPRDGWKDAAEIAFRVSKPSTVTVQVAGGSWTSWYPRGWHRLRWEPAVATRPGRHPIRITAVDRAGNTGVGWAGPAEVAADTTPPALVAELTPWRLYWSAVDDETPWISLRLRLTAPGRVETVRLGRVGLAGSVPVAAALDPEWSATLIASDSSGNATWLALGRVGALPALGRLLE